LLEQNDAWAVHRTRYMTLETMAPLSDDYMIRGLRSVKPLLGLPDRGRLNPGLRADLVVVNAETRAIEATIAGGRLTYLAGEAGCRFLSQPQALRMAAE
jgi:N-acyl-D-aspartate/D-glutamate deacylase